MECRDYEYIELLSKSWLKDIDEIMSTGERINEYGDLEIYVNCWMKFGVNMKFRVATIKDDYTLTYINGVKKEYKNRKFALNALLKAYNTVVDFRNFKNKNNIENEDIEKIQESELIETKEVEINEINEINDKQENNDKQNTYYTAGNLSFEKYEDAYNYCIASDFDPELMIKEIKESASNSTLKANKLHTNKVKIKILDKQIDKLIDESIELKKEIDKQNVKYNDRNNILIQHLENLDNKMNSIEERIDNLIKENKEIYANNFKLNLAALKEAYGDNKYKVINNNTGSILYTNNLENYLYNKDYSIKLILENREAFKQYIDTKKDSFYSNSYTIYTYKNKDSVNIIEEKEIYCLNTDKLLLKEIHRSKNNINICYCKTVLNKQELLTINGKQATHDTLNKAIEVFKKDNKIVDILDNYTIKDTVKTVKRTSKDDIELMLKDYRVAINKFPKLRELCENLDSYLNLYKNNYKQLFRKFKTNIIEFTNYRVNYIFYKKLLQMDLNTKEQINYTIPLRVRYTTHHNKYLSK